MKRIAIPLSLLLLATELSACGPDHTTGEDFRFWLLQPELTDMRGLRAFNFSTDKLYAYDPDQLVAMPYAANIAEWQAIVGAQVPDTAIAAILYGTDPLYYLEQEERLLRQNLFLRRLQPMGPEWVGFIRYAKSCERLVSNTDPWGFAEHDGPGIRRAWQEGLDLLKRAKDERLRARIAFQLVRLAHYQDDMGPKLDATPYYARHLAPLKGRSWLEGGAAFYLAGTLPNPERDLAYAALFERAPDKQNRMVQLFDNGRIDEYLSLAAGERHRAQLLVMRCLQHPGRAIADLEYIATWDPGNPHLTQLLGREVNKLEDWLLTPELTELGTAIGYWTYSEGVDPAEVYRTDLAYLQRLRGFIGNLLAEPRTVNKSVLQVLDGHLCLISGDTEGCRRVLGKVVDDPKAAPLLRLQARMDMLLAAVLEERRLSDVGRKALLSVVEAARTADADSVNVTVLLDQLHLYLGKKLIARGDRAEGLFLLTRSGRSYGNRVIYGDRNARYEAYMRAGPDDYDRMIAILDKPTKSAFEQYLVHEDLSAEGQDPMNRFYTGRFSRASLLDLKAMCYMRNGELNAAAAAWRQVPTEFWGQWPQTLFADDDPFIVDLKDPHNYEKEDRGSHPANWQGYTKLSIVERMIALRDEAERDPKKRGANHLLLGNAWYNMSWHGKYWIMQRIDWSMWEMSGYQERSPLVGDEQYYGLFTARHHYQQALQHAKDPAVKALACHLLEECERQWRMYNGWNGTEGEGPSVYTHLLTDRKSTAIYRELSECIGYDALVRRFK